MIVRTQLKINVLLTRWTALWVPDDIETNKEPCALLMFTNGIGEAGNNTEADLVKMFYHGPLAFATSGINYIFINPLNGKPKRFIVAAMQGTMGYNGMYPWAAAPGDMHYAIENDLKRRYPIDPNCVAITGLSAGGGEALNSVTSPVYSSIYCAAVPMSPASAGLGVTDTVTNDIRVWAFCGSSDYPYITNARNFTAQLNAAKPGNGTLTETATGHGPWNPNYDPYFRAQMVLRGKSYNVNIYEWILACSRNLVLTQPPDTPVIIIPKDPVPAPEPKPIPVPEPEPPKPAPPVARVERAIMTVRLPYSEVVRAHTSTGDKLKFRWEKISGPRVNIVAPEAADTWINSLQEGEYLLRVTVTDSAGQTSSADIALTVTDPNKPAPRVLVHYMVTPYYSDGTKGAEEKRLPGTLL